MARQSVKPLNSFSSNNYDLFNVQAQDLDLSNNLPTSIDVNIDSSGETNTEIGRHDSDTKKIANSIYK
jgi:hypothetical protein